MASNALAATLARRNVHYGWVVVAVTFFTLLVTAAAMGTPGVLIVPLEQEFGWSDAQISSALALRIMLFGLFGPFAAAFMNRYGVRRVIMVAMALISGGLLASLAMKQVWQLVLLWGVIVGIGTGLTAMVLAATVATRWFNHRRGLVMGLLAASNATGQLVFLPLIAHLTTDYGWRMALVFVACMLSVIAVLALLFMRDRPSDLNLPLYGESKITPAPAQGVGLAQRAVFAHQALGGQEQGQAARARRGVRQPRQDQMDDIVGDVVIAPGDEDLLTGEPPAVGAIALGPHGQGPEVRARLRLGEVHGPGPLA